MISINGVASARLNVKRSVFLAKVSGVRSLDEAKDFVRRVSKEHPDANHNCWAYRVFHMGTILEHYSDAGEPRGSAGAPMLNVLRRNNLVNVAAVVSRYFGGVKLGKRGLINAYSSVVEMALDEAETVRLVRVKLYRAYVEYPRLGKILSDINRIGGRVMEIQHGSDRAILIYSSSEPYIGEEIGEDLIEISP